MMENKHLLEIIFKLNIERKVFFEILPEQQAVFRGMVELAESSVTLEIDFSNYFPLEFPRFRIKNAQRFYPHVDRTGVICLFDDSSLLIKTNEPAQMLLDAYDRAIEILSIDVPFSITMDIVPFSGVYLKALDRRLCSTLSN